MNEQAISTTAPSNNSDNLTLTDFHGRTAGLLGRRHELCILPAVWRGLHYCTSCTSELHRSWALRVGSGAIAAWHRGRVVAPSAHGVGASGCAAQRRRVLGAHFVRPLQVAYDAIGYTARSVIRRTVEPTHSLIAMPAIADGQASACLRPSQETTTA